MNLITYDEAESIMKESQPNKHSATKNTYIHVKETAGSYV